MKLIYCRPEFIHGIRAIVGCYSPPKIVLQVQHQDWECSTDSRDRFSIAMDQSQKTILTPFNYFEWKAEMEILLRVKGLYRVTMATEADPMLLQRRSNGTIREMRPMASYVLVFPETSFSISMD